ncbi:proline-specific permease [Bisporella sp. PMI_857]|nr:proline-specific permease [Bisporella sp. PMI_857]
MTALIPVNAPVMEFPRRFLDRGVGFAVGWMYWFACTTISAQELVAVTSTIKFSYDDGATSLKWAFGESVDPAVWMSLFLVLVIIINMFPVKYFGELEYIFGCIKITFIVMLIIMMFILDTMGPRANSYHDMPVSTRYWDRPYSLFNNIYQVKGDDGVVQRSITGSAGTFLGLWSGILKSSFSFVGMEIVAATAAESRSLADAESMKMAARKISLRITILYVIAVLVASFLVPYNHPFINGGGQSVGSSSLFIIAVVEAGIPSAAHFFNAIFVLSSFTCAVNATYVASRVLHTLALRDQTGPEFITRRLRQCTSGVPVRSVLVTGAMMLIGYMGRTGSPGQRLRELSHNVAISYFIMYAVICATYLSFFQTLENVKSGFASESQAAKYNRNHPRYPYKSHGQWLRAAYGMAACTILLSFCGINAFLESPFNARQFISSYIGIAIFICLILSYKIHKYSVKFFHWGPERSCDLSGAIQAASGKRKGRLEFPDWGFTRENVRAFIKWIWVWTK